MNRRIAIIDLGTNTFNLLVADVNSVKIERILSLKDGVALGLGGINENKLAPDAIERGIASLAKFCKTSREFNVEKIYAFGTSAVRNASNAHELLDRAKIELDLHIEVISGQREAELIYKGVKLGYNFSNRSLIMDIGGGSTEFILADLHGIEKAESFEIGVSRIFQLFQFSDPMTKDDCNRVISYLEEETGDFFSGMKCDYLVGASGSFETFYKIAKNTEFPDNAYIEMEIEAVVKSLNEIIASTQEERDRNELIIPIRKKMAPLAAIKTKWIIDKLKIKTLVISPYALKEGLMTELQNEFFPPQEG